MFNDDQSDIQSNIQYERFSQGPMPVELSPQTRRPTVPVDSMPHALQVGKQEGRLSLAKHAKRITASEILVCVHQL